MQDLKTEALTEDFNVRDWLLIALTFSSGAIDAISYFGLGKVFSAFMTGNIVFLGFGIVNAGGPNFLSVICALACFAVGAFLGTRISLPLAQSHGLWPGRVSATLTLVAAVEAVSLLLWLATDGATTAVMINVFLALFSLAMGLQTAAVRALGVQGVFTTAATFTFLALAGDFAGSRPKAEAPRLAGVLAGLVAGAIAGGLLFAHALTYAPVLPLVVTIFVILAGAGISRKAAPDRFGAAR